jgi:hypothetical protein
MLCAEAGAMAIPRRMVEAVSIDHFADCRLIREDSEFIL